MIYHKITAANPLMPNKISSGIHMIRKMKLTLLSFQDKFLNFNENIGISDTNSHEKSITNIKM